ncbi:MAG: rhamnogalacturonan acetylesterase [Dysgonomonas sp.]
MNNAQYIKLTVIYIILIINSPIALNAQNSRGIKVNDVPTKKARSEAIVSGSTRINEEAPVVFIIGDSTVKNGRGYGDNDQWGWGSFFHTYLDTTRISVENHALGGTSSRTFFTNGLWYNVLPGIKKGDFLLIQFGHNDGGPSNTGRARASLKGIGEESEVVVLESNGKKEEVFTFGHYLRIYIEQAKAVGAIPIVLSPTPRNRWKDGKADKLSESYNKWAKEAAEQENVAFVDLNSISSDKLTKMGEEKGKSYFADSVHTTYEGAIMNDESIIEGVLRITDFPLNKYIISKK